MRIERISNGAILIMTPEDIDTEIEVKESFQWADSDKGQLVDLLYSILEVLEPNSKYNEENIEICKSK